MHPYWTNRMMQSRKKLSHIAKKKVIFQNNTSAHTSIVSVAKLHEPCFKLVDHPSYALELAHCDFRLFPDLKR